MTTQSSILAWKIPRTEESGGQKFMGSQESDINFLLFFKSLFLAVLDLCCCSNFSLVVASRGYSLVALQGLLLVVASPVAEHRL